MKHEHQSVPAQPRNAVLALEWGKILGALLLTAFAATLWRDNIVETAWSPYYLLNTSRIQHRPKLWLGLHLPWRAALTAAFVWAILAIPSLRKPWWLPWALALASSLILMNPWRWLMGRALLHEMPLLQAVATELLADFMILGALGLLLWSVQLRGWKQWLFLWLEFTAYIFLKNWQIERHAEWFAWRNSGDWPFLMQYWLGESLAFALVPLLMALLPALWLKWRLARRGYPKLSLKESLLARAALREGWGWRWAGRVRRLPFFAEVSEAPAWRADDPAGSLLEIVRQR
jgi:hypothetical protein